MKQYYPEIDICKGIAILLVLLWHSFIRYPINLLEHPLSQQVGHWFLPFFLAVFFVVSGFLFAQSAKKVSFVELLKKRFTRLMIPYFAFEAVNLCVKLAVPSLVNRKVESTGEYIDKLLLHGGELWFVYVLFFIFVIWGWALPRMKKQYVVFALVVMYIATQFGAHLPNDIFLSSRVIDFSQYFLIGYLLPSVVIRGGYCKSFIISVIAIYIIINGFLYKAIYPLQQYAYLYTFIGCAVCFVISSSTVDTIVGKALGYVGRYSLQFYILNGFALVPARMVVVKILHINEPWMIVTTVFVLNLVLEIIMLEILKRMPFVRWCFGINKK